MHNALLAQLIPPSKGEKLLSNVRICSNISLICEQSQQGYSDLEQSPNAWGYIPWPPTSSCCSPRS